MIYIGGSFVGLVASGYFFEFFCNRFDSSAWWWGNGPEMAFRSLSALCVILIHLVFVGGVGLLPFSIYACAGTDRFFGCLFFTLPWWD